MKTKTLTEIGNTTYEWISKEKANELFGKIELFVYTDDDVLKVDTKAKLKELSEKKDINFMYIVGSRK